MGARRYRKIASAVWCDFHCEVHAAETDLYDEHHDSDTPPECNRDVWRPVYMLLDDKEDPSGM